MSRYINQDYLVKEIINQSRHQLIYRNDKYPTNELITKIEEQYPLVFDASNPVCINVKDYGISPTNNVDKQSSEVNRSCDIFFTCSIAYEIINKINNLDGKEANIRLARLIKLINDYFLRNKENKIDDVLDLLKILKQTMNYYKCNNKNQNDLPPEEILYYIRPDFFINELKMATNNSSYFGIVIDNKKDISTNSIKTINSFIYSRINKDLSIKVLTDPKRWNTFTTSTGNYIESVHDYGIVELDDSYEKYIKSLKRSKI